MKMIFTRPVSIRVKMTYLPAHELGFLECGQNVLISSKASVYNPSKIRIGSNVRIDDFCVLSAGEGGIEIGDYVHLSHHVALSGAGKITLKSFSSCSSKCTLLSSTDDFSGEYMTNSTVPLELRNVYSAPITIGSYSVIGAGTTILPGVTIVDRVSVGAMSLVKESLLHEAIYGGIPCRWLKDKVRPTQLRVRLLSEHAVLPRQGTVMAAGYDLSSAYEYVIPPHGKVLVKTDLAIEVPPGTYGRVAPRSGLAWKKHLDVGAGVIDRDYRGNVGVILFNHSAEEVTIARHDRVAQLILEQHATAHIVLVDALDDTERGTDGYGSTGK
jgi:deoxyuridine 5'-triphosphate nucleotidohydrolase